jgi:hypothetical protein
MIVSPAKVPPGPEEASWVNPRTVQNNLYRSGSTQSLLGSISAISAATCALMLTSARYRL